MRRICCLAHTLLLLSTVSALEAHNPYRHFLELLLQEPGGVTSQIKTAVEEFWITQKVDHFDKSNNQTWQMRYLCNAKYHRAQGPIYIMVGGEWTIYEDLLSRGLTHDMAVENGGMLYYTEHRYYGKSLPLGSRSLSQLQFLNLRQALADLAHFISYQKAQSISLRNSKVFLVGGSYAGTMVTWMTQLYPKLVSASWASSAPLLVKTDNFEYMEAVSQSIELSYGSSCMPRIEQRLEHLAKFLNSENATELLNRINACKKFNANDEFDRMTFFNGIGNYFAWIVQSKSAYISKLCNTILSQNDTEAEALQSFLELIYNIDHSKDTCMDFSYNAMLQLYIRDANTRAWFYQTCNEFGWFVTTSSRRVPSFANQVPLKYFQRLCHDAFGKSSMFTHLEEIARQTNALFGGNIFDHSQRYQKVIFTHGELDPWRPLGQQNGSQALIIPGYSHVPDFGSIDVREGVALNLAKLRVMSFLRRRL